ncbi:MAG: type I glutamate--ammonia ligase [Candidatus Bipolaricaulota bacterium]|nr:type I glutamate--ammonia ligase [Candidatus Bipolaricaulota bacterium]
MIKGDEGSFDRLREKLDESGVEFIDVKAVDPIGRWRHITIPKSSFTRELVSRGIGFDSSSYGYSSVENSDMLLAPDLETAKLEPTEEGEVLSLIGDIYQIDEEGNRRRFPRDPRRTIVRARNYLRETQIADDFLVSPEFEFYLFNDARFYYGTSRGGFEVDSVELSNRKKSETDEEPHHPLPNTGGYHAPRPGDDGIELRNRMVAFLEREGIPVKYHHHEVGGAGESEIEVGFDDLLTASDNTLYIKHIVRIMAKLSGMSATFMPKPVNDFPGNGMHLHQYMVKDGENLFSGDKYGGLSELALHFIGGLLEHGRSIMGLTNPTTNSYKRLIPGHEAPVDLVFARSNRSAAVRIPGYVQSGDRRRVELRTLDATCNPYLAYSAILMAGLDGIERELDPQDLGYGPIEKNIYDLPEKEKKRIKQAPESLSASLNALEKDHGYLLKGNVFEESQIKNWLRIKRNEGSLFDDKPHPFEFMLYYDL